jgi:hypothetical protein
MLFHTLTRNSKGQKTEQTKRGNDFPGKSAAAGKARDMNQIFQPVRLQVSSCSRWPMKRNDCRIITPSAGIDPREDAITQTSFMQGLYGMKNSPQVAGCRAWKAYTVFIGGNRP